MLLRPRDWYQNVLVSQTFFHGNSGLMFSICLQYFYRGMQFVINSVNAVNYILSKLLNTAQNLLKVDNNQNVWNVNLVFITITELLLLKSIDCPENFEISTLRSLWNLRPNERVYNSCRVFFSSSVFTVLLLLPLCTRGATVNFSRQDQE